MILAVPAVPMKSGIPEQGRIRGEGERMALQHLAGKIAQREPSERRSRAGEIAIDERLVESDDVEELAAAAERFTGAAAGAAARLAGERFTKFCFLGTGALRAVAVESALKVLELTAGRVYTWSESYLGVRHGPLSAVDDETLVLGFLSGDGRRRAYELDLLREVGAKGLAAKIVAVWPSEVPRDAGFDESLSLGLAAGFDDLHRPPLDVIFGQLFGLFNSLGQGLKPDTPSPKGAITRVVERVRIH